MESRFLITGAAGFVGANLARDLAAAGHEVHALLRRQSDPWRLAGLDIPLHAASLDSVDELRRMFAAARPTCIVHCAAYGGYLGLQTDARLMFETNVLGTLNLLQAADTVPEALFLNVGSSSEYGVKDHPMGEADVPEPVNVYGVSKVSQTLLCQAHARITGRRVITVRLFSVYGPREPRGRLLPNVLLACLAGEPVRLAGGGRQARDFVSAADVARGIARLARHAGLDTPIVNLGTGTQTTVARLAELARDLTGSASEIQYDAYPHKGIENPVWVADTATLERMTGWRPDERLEDTLPTLIEWYRSHRHLYDAASSMA